MKDVNTKELNIPLQMDEYIKGKRDKTKKYGMEGFG